jgi:hypothetical protein
MKKGQRPSKHIRRLKTSTGVKSVIVNPALSKKPKGVIRPTERKIFGFISDRSNFDKEYGGAIDFDKKGEVEVIAMLPGIEDEVWVPSDYEVQFHTDPDWDPMITPSVDDIESIATNPRQQAEIIFQNGKAFTIVTTSKSRSLRKLKKKDLRKKISAALENIPRWDENGFKKSLEELGFIVQINEDMSKDMNINISPVEPRKKRRN